MSTRLARLLSILLFGCLAAIGIYWVLQLSAPKTVIAPASQLAIPGSAGSTASGQVGGTSAIANLFGGAAKDVPATPAPVSNIQVQGIITGQRGSALLVIDGKPGRPVAVGESFAQDSKLIAVSGKDVVIEQNGKRVTLAPPPKATIAVLQSGVGKARTPRTGAPNSNAAPYQAPPPPVYQAPAPLQNPAQTLTPPPPAPPAAAPGAAGSGAVIPGASPQSNYGAAPVAGVTSATFQPMGIRALANVQNNSQNRTDEASQVRQ
jgi:general secretion pathway protein C